MKIGVNLFLWSDSPSYDQFAKKLEYIKGVGFDGVEFPVPGIDKEQCKKFSALCDDLGLGRTAIATMDPSLCDPISDDKALREASLDYMKEWLERSAEIGSKILAGPFFQGLGRSANRVRTQEEWDRCLDVLYRVAEIAKPIGVDISLEPVNRFEIYFCNNMKDSVKFVKELGQPNVGILADTMHSNIEENNITEAYKNAMPYINHVHISECNRGTPGAGHAIPDDLFQGLHDAGYDGWCTIEAFTGGTAPSLVPALHLWNDPEDSADQICEKGYKFIRAGIDAIK